MREWIIKKDIELSCEDMVLYRGVEKLLNSFRRKEMGYGEVIDNIANYVRQKEKEIREDERGEVIEEIRGMKVKGDYPDAELFRFNIIRH